MNFRKALILTFALGGCASMTHGKNQRVIISTPGAPHAVCAVTSESLGVRYIVTPEALVLPRSSEQLKVSCHKKCFEDTARTFEPDLNTEDLASNGFFGFAPLAVDLATQRAYNYSYDLTLPMSADHRCKKTAKGYLDGNPRDFDNRIEDFSFDGPPPLPEEPAKDMKIPEEPPTIGVEKDK